MLTVQRLAVLGNSTRKLFLLISITRKTGIMPSTNILTLTRHKQSYTDQRIYNDIGVVCNMNSIKAVSTVCTLHEMNGTMCIYGFS